MKVRNRIIKLLGIVILITFVNFNLNPNVVEGVDYSKVEQEKELWDAENITDDLKTWNIQFNGKIGNEYLKSEYIYIKDSLGKIHTTSLNKDNEMVLITPEKPYKSNETYTLYIESGIKSEKGHELKRTVKKAFTLKESIDQDFIKVLNDAEFHMSGYRYDYEGKGKNTYNHNFIWANVVDQYNEYYLDTRWTQYYEENDYYGGIGVVEFRGIQPSDYHPWTGENWKDKNVYAKFVIPYTPEKGYESSISPDTEEEFKSVYIYEFKRDGYLDIYIYEYDYWLTGVDTVREYLKYESDGRIVKIK